MKTGKGRFVPLTQKAKRNIEAMRGTDDEYVFGMDVELLDAVFRCWVPDDWLLKNKRSLLHSREVLQAVLATWQASAEEWPC